MNESVTIFTYYIHRIYLLNHLNQMILNTSDPENLKKHLHGPQRLSAVTSLYQSTRPYSSLTDLHEIEVYEMSWPLWTWHYSHKNCSNYHATSSILLKKIKRVVQCNVYLPWYIVNVFGNVMQWFLIGLFCKCY